MAGAHRLGPIQLEDRFVKKRLWSKLMSAAAALISLVAHPAAHAQYPDRPLRFVVPFAAGSAPDIMARF